MGDTIKKKRKDSLSQRPTLTPIHQNLHCNSSDKVKECNRTVGSLLLSSKSSVAESLSVTPSCSGSDESRVVIFEETDQIALPVSFPVSYLKPSTSFTKISNSIEQLKKPLSSKIDIEYVPRNMERSERERKTRSNLRSGKLLQKREEKSVLFNDQQMYTIEDIMEEMNQLATKNAIEGMRIPNGTMLTLRRHNEENREMMNDEQSCTGWSFAEASEISTLGPITNEELLYNQNFSPKQSRNSRAYIDITDRFCGGHYHLALLSGMASGTPDMEV